MLSENHRHSLKKLARASIEHGLNYGQPLQVDLATVADEFTEQRATFVTLEKQGKLRGCVGKLQAHRALAKDIAENSFAAAFSDSRFPSLSKSELDKISIHLSLLSPSEIIPCQSEAELIQQLRPNIDGLILDDGHYRATFLPSVWKSIPNPVDFIRHLKNKAGLPINDWSPKLLAYRYTTESF